MYRINYTYTGPAIEGIPTGAARTIHMSTAYAFIVYANWRRSPFAADVSLEQWSGGRWVTLQAANTTARQEASDVIHHE